MDQWNSEEKIDLTPEKIQEYKEKIAQNVALPGDAQTWVDALRTKDIFKVRKLLKKERQNLPTQYKKLYRDSDDKVLLAIHTMRTQAPFFTPQEKKESQLFIEFAQAKADGVEHPLLNRKLF